MNAIYAAKSPIGHTIAKNNAVPGVILFFSIPFFLVESELHRRKKERSDTIKYENTAS